MKEKAEKLRKHIEFDEGKKIRQELHGYALKNYQPQHAANDYIAFMDENVCTFSIIHPQSKNHPWYMGLFTEISQHVYGDCVSECLDRAMSHLSF